MITHLIQIFVEKTKKLCFGLLSNRLYIYLFFFHFSWFFEWDDQLKLESKRSNKLYFKTDEVLFNEPSSKLLAKSLMGSRPHHAFVFVSVCKLRRREYGGCTVQEKENRHGCWANYSCFGILSPSGNHYLCFFVVVFSDP